MIYTFFIGVTMHITVLCLSTSLQRTSIFENLTLNAVNRSTHFTLAASGKGLNTARVLSQIDENCVTPIAPIGKENAGIFLNLAKKDSLNMIPIRIPGFTRECVTVIDKSTSEVTELVMDEPPLTGFLMQMHIKHAEQEILDKAKFCFGKSDGFVFSGSTPKIYSKDLPSKLCSLALEMDLTVLVDFQGEDLLNVLKTCTPTIIKINELEFCHTFNIEKNLSQEELHTEISKKSSELQNLIIITRGTNPTLASFNGENYIQDIEPIKAVNTIGCGDSFNAGFIHEYLRTKEQGNLDIQSALARGTWCASRNAESESVGSIV